MNILLTDDEMKCMKAALRAEGITLVNANDPLLPEWKSLRMLGYVEGHDSTGNAFVIDGPTEKGAQGYRDEVFARASMQREQTTRVISLASLCISAIGLCVNLAKAFGDNADRVASFFTDAIVTLLIVSILGVIYLCTSRKNVGRSLRNKYEEIVRG